MIGNEYLIPDPDFDEWVGTFIGIEDAPVLKYDLRKILHYMQKKKKKDTDLTEQEIEMFRISGR